MFNSNWELSPFWVRMAGEPRLIQGILVPFARAQDSRYRNYWDAQTDFGFGQYRERPLFFRHAFDEALNGRAGTILDEHLSLRAAGVYAVAEVESNAPGDAVLDLIDRNVGAWSSGTMPNYIRSDPVTGYISRWWIVEGSIAHRDHTDALHGLTLASNLREAGDPDEIVHSGRSFFMSDVSRVPHLREAAPLVTPQPPTLPTPPPPAPPAPQPDNAAILQAINGLGARLTALEQAPTAALPAGNPLGEHLRTQPQISVSSPYDGVSLLGMLLWDTVRQQTTPAGRVHKRDEPYMRALFSKIEAVRNEQPQEVIHIDEETSIPTLRAVDADTEAAWRQYTPNLRANELMGSEVATAGDELVPTSLNAAAWYAFRTESRLFGLLQSFMMPTNPFDWPTVSGAPTIRRVQEATDISQAALASSVIPASRPTTGKITFNAKPEGIGAMALASRAMFDDAGISVADALATMWSRNIADAIDYVLINGDEDATTTNISHYGTDPTGTAYDKILILNGLRKLAASASDTADVGSLGIDDLTTLQLLMGARGIIGTDLANLVALVDPGVYYKLKVLTEFRTRDKVGEEIMTIANGFVGSWDRIPVVLSDQMEWMTVDTNRIPAAHNIATGGDSGGLLLVHRLMNKIGVKRDITIESGWIPHASMYAVSGTVRFDVQAMQSGSVAFGYGITI